MVIVVSETKIVIPCLAPTFSLFGLLVLNTRNINYTMVPLNYKIICQKSPMYQININAEEATLI